MKVDLQNIETKLDQILEFQKKQERLNRIKFWINLILILVFFVLPLLLLPFVISQFISIYTGSFDSQNLGTTTENIQEIFNLLQ